MNNELLSFISNTTDNLVSAQDAVATIRKFEKRSILEEEALAKAYVLGLINQAIGERKFSVSVTFSVHNCPFSKVLDVETISKIVPLTKFEDVLYSALTNSSILAILKSWLEGKGYSFSYSADKSLEGNHTLTVSWSSAAVD